MVCPSRLRHGSQLNRQRVEAALSSASVGDGHQQQHCPWACSKESSTQNDLVVSFWLLAFALFALQYLRKPTVGHMAWCGTSPRLCALLTKGTAYAVRAAACTAMLLLYGIIHAPGTRPRVQLVAAATVILAIALVVNSGHWTRNWELFRHPWPHHLTLGDLNAEINVSVVWSNLVRHAALHLGVPSDRINAITRLMSSMVSWGA